MMRRIGVLLFVTMVVGLSVCSVSYGAHPLITDDTGTQGKWRTQIEINGEYDVEKEDGEHEYTTQANSTISFGTAENVDLVLTIPYQYTTTREEDAGESSTDSGLSDMVFEVKWRFYENQGLSFAFKPGISFPTGNDRKGLGSGRVGYSFYFITTKERELWTFHCNLGYMRNENKIGERENLWHASIAGEYEVAKGLLLVANTGFERNAEEESDTPPAFLIAGVIWSPIEALDLDAGMKFGLNRPEVDYAPMAGITYRF